MKKKKQILVSIILFVCLFFFKEWAQEPSATLTPSDPSLKGYFPIGVWLQDPTKIRNGKTIAQNYKDIGVNLFMGLWLWPDESGMYVGYASKSLQTLKDLGLRAYAGGDLTAVQWIKAHPEFADTLIGYILGDEPDMNKVNKVQAVQPDTWQAAGEAIRASDPSRQLYGNFGKGFALDPWVGYHIGPGPMKADDFGKYVGPLTVCSSDYYGITDPYEAQSLHGVWTYGLAVVNTKRYAGKRPVWGVLEASAPFSGKDGHSDSQMYMHMPASFIMPVVWEMVLHGATGIGYFCHDFSNGGLIIEGALVEPGMPEAMKAANESLSAYAGVLNSPDIKGTTITTHSLVAVAVLTKRFNGKTYIFAMGDGNATHRDGLSLDADIAAKSMHNGTFVDVLNEKGEEVKRIIVIDGKITDHFGPYELHIYRF